MVDDSTFFVAQNIMRTEAAVYFKYSLLRLINLGYQVRAGVVAAGDHGAAQVYQLHP